MVCTGIRPPVLPSSRQRGHSTPPTGRGWRSMLYELVRRSPSQFSGEKNRKNDQWCRKLHGGDRCRIYVSLHIPFTFAALSYLGIFWFSTGSVSSSNAEGKICNCPRTRGFQQKSFNKD